MEKIKDNLLAELLADPDNLSGTEKLIRKLNDKCGEMFTTYRIIKYPIIYDRPQWRIIITLYKKDKEVKLHDYNSMYFEEVLKSAIKFMEDYKIKHKTYDLSKSGGGFDFI